MRLGEARNLELQDVDLKMALLTIRDSRIWQVSPRAFARIDLPKSTCPTVTLLGANVIGKVGPVSSYLFVSSQGNRLDGGDIHRTFYAVSRQIGLRGISDNHGPRPARHETPIRNEHAGNVVSV